MARDGRGLLAFAGMPDDAAFRRPEQAVHEAHERGLAGAVVAQQQMVLAAAQMPVDVVQDHFLPGIAGQEQAQVFDVHQGTAGNKGGQVSIQNSCRIVPDGSQPSCGTSKKGQPAGDRAAGNRPGAPARKLAGDPRCGHARGLPRTSLFRIRRAGEGMEDWGKGNSSRAGSDPMAARRAVPVSAAGASRASTVERAPLPRNDIRAPCPCLQRQHVLPALPVPDAPGEAESAGVAFQTGKAKATSVVMWASEAKVTGTRSSAASCMMGAQG